MESKILETIGIDPGYIFIGIIAVLLIVIILLIVLLVKTNSMKKKYEYFMKGKDGKSLEESIMSRFKQLDDVSVLSSKNESDIKKILANLKITYQKMGIVKYDAFSEMGGKLSFALALLDKNNNGFVINAMHSREGCYTYIKEILNGESYIVLAEEEKKALQEALKV